MNVIHFVAELLEQGTVCCCINYMATSVVLQYIFSNVTESLVTAGHNSELMTVTSGHKLPDLFVIAMNYSIQITLSFVRKYSNNE